MEITTIAITTTAVLPSMIMEVMTTITKNLLLVLRLNRKKFKPIKKQVTATKKLLVEKLVVVLVLVLAVKQKPKPKPNHLLIKKHRQEIRNHHHRRRHLRRHPRHRQKRIKAAAAEAKPKT